MPLDGSSTNSSIAEEPAFTVVPPWGGGCIIVDASGAMPPASSGDISPTSLGTIFSVAGGGASDWPHAAVRPVIIATTAASGARNSRLTVTPPRLDRGQVRKPPILQSTGRTGV